MVDEHYVKTLGEVAAIFGVGLDAVKQWRTGPDPMPGQPKAWPVYEIVRWRFARTVREPRPANEKRETLELTKLETEVKHRQKRLSLLEGRLIDVEIATRVIERVIVEFNSLLEQVTERVIAAVPAAGTKVKATTHKQLTTKINSYIDDLRNTMAQGLEEWSRAAGNESDEDGGPQTET